MTSTHPTPRTWFITGASKGLGRAFTEAALAAGDRVVAVARTMADATIKNPQVVPTDSDRLLRITTDVTDRAAVFAAVDQAVQHFGQLDVVVNNAGTLTMGFVEEYSEAEARRQLETNFFGALWVSQAAMAVFRRQRSGHLLQVSSIAGLGGFPSSGLYSASKFALEGLSEALALEAAAFDAKVTILQPGGYWTDLYNTLALATEIDDYAPLRQQLAEQFAGESIDSDPKLAAEAVMTLVDSEDPPRRLLLGSMVYDLAFTLTDTRREDWAAWEQTSRAAEQAIPDPRSVPPAQ